MPLFGPPNIERMEEKKDVNGLIKALKHEDWYVRGRAARALGRMGDARAVEPLIQALNDRDNYTRTKVAESLNKIEIQNLKSKDSRVRHEALRVLGEVLDRNKNLMDTGVRKALVEALEDEDKEIRLEATRTLAKFPYTQDDTKKAYCLIAENRWEQLAELGVEPLIPALECSRAHSDVRKEVARVLGEKGDTSAVGSLVYVLKDEGGGMEGKEVRLEVAKALCKIGKPAVEPLIKALYDEGGWVRHETVEALGEIGDTRAIEPLLKALHHGDSHNNEAIIKAVVKMGEPAVEPLIKALKDREDYVKSGAVRALGEIGNAKALEALIQVLKDYKDGTDKVQSDVARALGEIRDSRAVEPLMQAFEFWAARSKADSCHVQDRVTEALGEIGDLRVAEAIIDWLFMPEQVGSGRIRGMKNLFGDYTDFILKASVGYIKSDARVTRTMDGPNTEGVYDYDLRESDEAIRELCKISTQISNNILHKISQKKDILVVVSWVCAFEHVGYLSFESQRQIAMKELEQRGNPPYDPSAYLNKEAWKL